MNAVVQLGRKIQYLFIALLLASFAVVQSVRAVSPEPSEGDLIVNMAEEGDAVAEPGSDTVEAAVGQAANTPNQRVINFNIKEPLGCAGGDVILRGNVVVTFQHTSEGKVQPASIKLEGFTGIAKSGNRKLVVPRTFHDKKNLIFTRCVRFSDTPDGRKEGTFSFRFYVTGPGLPGGLPLSILVRYPCGVSVELCRPCPSPNRYIYEQGEVRELIPAKPNVECVE